MEGLSQNEKIIWSCWEAKSPREVVREAAAKGTHIALAIRYLKEKNNWSEDTASDWFYAEVKAWTVQLLMAKQIFKVLHVLNKVQINTEDHLMTLACEASTIFYRDFIVENLEKISKDIKAENKDKWEYFRKHWNLLRYLEKSFEIEGTFKQNKMFGSVQDRVIVTETEIKELTIQKIVKYSDQWKSKVATALFFDYFEFSLLEFSSSTEVWNFLLERNKAMILVRWINIHLSELVRDMNARYNFFNNEGFAKKLLHVDTKGFDIQIIDKLDNLFRNWPITKEMIEAVSKSNCFAYTKMCIYDTLCSYGIVNEDERKNIYAIISRLARTQNLKLIDDIFTETCSTMRKTDFYVELSKYCVKNKLYNVLAISVENDVLDTDFSEVQDEARDVIELWLSFKRIEHTADKQSHVVPVYKTCEQIAKDNIDDYIISNPYLVLGMILLEDNAKLFNIFSKEDFLQFKDFRLTNRGYKDKLPHLYSVFKKYSGVDQPSEIRDVNVYQLLSDYRGLDVSKVFEFQLVNHNYNSGGNETPDRRSLGSLLTNTVDIDCKSIQPTSQRAIDMPHFANEKLMKRYGYVAKLNHIYYLKQYRPCNASQAFVAQQYQMYNRLQEKSIKSACCEAHALALQNWSDPAMTACSISFVAMIGCNPTRCRVHMTAASMIKRHLKKTMPDETASKIVNDYMAKLLQGNEVAAKEILKYLEEITLLKVKEMEDSKLDMSVVLYESQPMVKFAALHNLPLPDVLLKDFVSTNSWFNFLLFADVFRYPLSQMLQLTEGFENKCYAEHMKHIMMYRNVEEGAEKDKMAPGGAQRRMSRMNSVDVSPTSSASFSFPGGPEPAPPGPRELWELAARCHGPDDPPGALARAAAARQLPVLALLATCYEPNAVGVLWACWVAASLGEAPGAQWDISQQRPTDDQVKQQAERALRASRARTLHESCIVFCPESPLTTLTAFLCRCTWQRAFDSETSRLLQSFTQMALRKNSDSEPWSLSRRSLHEIAISLVEIALGSSFDSALHQRHFLKCLVDAQFGKDFLAPSPDFEMIHEILQISMETSTAVNVAKILQDDTKQYLTECVEMYTHSQHYDVALKIAKLAGLPSNEVLLAEWNNKHYTLLIKEDGALEDKDWTLFIAECSEAFKKASVSFNEAISFLLQHVSEIKDTAQLFYSYRVVLGWFDDNRQFGAQREQLEHAMWDAYFESEDVFLNSDQSTLHFILNGQKDESHARKMSAIDRPFSMLLREIEIESEVNNIEIVVGLEDAETIDCWRKTLNNLLELKLMVEAFRLSALYSAPTDFKYRPPPCPVQLMVTCLKLAERSCSPYELPQELRLVISSPTFQSRLSLSDSSDASFEELVVIQEKQDNAQATSSHLAAREDADRLSALEALAARSGLTAAKQVAKYFRISLQIGWTYASILKYQNNPLDFINFVSGRARMALANLVFRTFNISSKLIAEFLCNEMVSAVISPHLVKTSAFRQKEHFQYTLWGYVLNSDIEMFLNMRPDACTHIGRLVLDHLMAFRKIYKSHIPAQLDDATLDDSYLDVETLIDEEYQNVDESEVESLMTKSSGAMSGETETESVFSVSTVYSVGNNMSRESRRNLFDVISKSNVHIRYEIKSNVRRITKGAKLSTKQVNMVSIELLVVAHECFSCACDAEGVAVALRSAQALTAQLLAARSWRLMVRLLTGLGRYTEMAYIFQTLRDNHQFEFLLGQFDYMIGQQQEKITEFKQGLLDFLKTHCPGDTDTYIMVALHFNMYSEAANVKRKQATDLIADLEKLALDAARATSKKPFKPPEWLMIHENNSTRSILETALNHCTDAAELYLQGGCMGFAGEMAELAQQVALQTALLGASPTRLVLGRSAAQRHRLVTEYLGFMEGLVLVGGGGGGGAQWRELAYRRVLARDQQYLRELAACRPDLARHFIHRYESEKNTTAASQAAVAELRSLFR